MDVGGRGEHAPQPLGREQHHDDGDQPQKHQIPGPERRKPRAQKDEDDGPDDRPLDGPQPADDDDENHIGRPVHQRERRIGRNARLLQEIERADQPRPERGEHIDQELGAVDIDPHAFGGDLSVLDGRKRQPQPRAQHDIGDDHDHHDNRQRPPIDDDLARRRRANPEQLCGEIAPDHFRSGRARQRRAGAPAQCRPDGGDQPEHFGHHPGDHREIGALQSEHHPPHRNGQQRHEPRRDQHRNQRIGPHHDHHVEHAVGAHAHKGLLPHRDQPRIAGHEVPALRKPDQHEDQDQILKQRAIDETGCGEQGQHHKAHDDHADFRHFRIHDDAVIALGRTERVLGVNLFCSI